MATEGFDNLTHTAFNERTAFTLLDEQGQQCLYIRARDQHGNGFGLVKYCVVLNSILPFVSVSTIPQNIYQTSQYYTITGMKLPGTSVYLNGSLIINTDDSLEWSYTLKLLPGANSFSFTSKDNYGRTSETVLRQTTYVFTFNGVNTAVLKADAEGNWEAPVMSLLSQDPNDIGKLFDIIVETSDDFGNVASTIRTVLVTEQGPKIEITDPPFYAPVNCDQHVLFRISNPDPLTFAGPYTVTADQDGNWLIDGIGLNPADFVHSTDPNQEIVVSVLNQDGNTYESTVSIHVRSIESVEIQLDNNVIATDLVPPFTTLELLALGHLDDGTHTVKIITTDYLGFNSTDQRTFLVDTSAPVVKITSPDSGETISTIGTPILEYEIESVSPILRKTVYIDGIDVGAIESGSALPSLKDGVHSLTVEVETMARCEGYAAGEGYGYGYGYEGYGYGQNTATGKIATASVSFIYLRPVTIDATDELVLNIGNDIDNENHADAVIEELRILNVPSTAAEILADWQLLSNGLRFQNVPVDEVDLTAEQLALIADQGLDKTRISLPKNTLVLSHFDNNVLPVSGVDNTITDSSGNVTTTENGLPLDLEVATGPIIDESAARNQLAIDVFVSKNDRVDRELIKESIDRIIPARGEALVVFETVTDKAKQ